MYLNHHYHDQKRSCFFLMVFSEVTLNLSEYQI